MGQATIVSEQGAGLYTIAVDYGTERLDNLIWAIDARITELSGDPEGEDGGLIGEAQAELAEKEAEGEQDLIDTMTEAQTAYVDAVKEGCTPEGWEADPVAEELAKLIETSQTLAEVRDEIAQYQQTLATQQIQKEVLDKAVPYLENDYDEKNDAADDAYDDVLSTVEDLNNAVAACQAAGDYSDECWEAEAMARDLARIVYNQAVDEKDAAYDLWQTVLEQLEDLEDDIADSESLLSAAQDELQPAQEAVTAASNAYKDAVLLHRDELVKCQPANYITEIRAIYAASSELLQYRAELDFLRTKIAMLQAELANLQRRKELLQGVLVEKEIIAWCADYSTGETGEVETIEVPGEPQQVVLTPGCASPNEANGVVRAREVMTPSQAYWNAAVLPGWQKWMPTYRVGVLSAIDYDNDTGTVTFSSTSTAQSLGIDQSETIVGVEIDYMTCDSLPFANGDRVVVKFASYSWDAPTIIGFESNPKQCPALAYRLSFQQVSGANPSVISGLCSGIISLDEASKTYVVMPDGSEKTLWVTVGSASVAYNGSGEMHYQADGYYWYQAQTFYGVSAWVRRVHNSMDYNEQNDPWTCTGSSALDFWYPSALYAPELPPGSTAPPEFFQKDGFVYQWTRTVISSIGYIYYSLIRPVGEGDDALPSY